MTGEKQRYPLSEYSVYICFTNTDQLITSWTKMANFFLYGSEIQKQQDHSDGIDD
jgi:hypothetical protein